MFGPPGHLYVYFTYGMHWCANVGCREEGVASAVLLRAGEVVEGAELARIRRPSARTDRDLCRGPARLSAALGISGADNGADVVDAGSAVQLRPGSGGRAPAIRSGPRVGVGGAGAPTPWRYWLDGEPTVSPYRPHAPRRKPGPDAPARARQ
jgi:DNA-3-methyladenine glycosylase